MSLSSSRTFLGTALIAFAVLAVYGGTVGFGFVFDDHVQIERNPWLRHPDGFRLFLTRPFWGFYPDRGPAPSNYYRPVFGFAYSLVARIWGLQPAAFHAASVLLHAAVSLLVALGARRFFRDGRLFRNDTAALAAGLLFAVYPAHAEAVAWVAGQADLLAALFVLAATFAYLQSPKSLLGPIAYFLACLSKETGAALIVVLAAVEISEWRREGSPGAALRRAAVRLAPYGLALAVYVVLRVHALGGFAPRHYSVAATPAGAVAFAGALLARYLGFLAVPFPARVLTSVPAPTLLSPLALAGLAAAGLALLGLGIAAWRGRARREIVLPLAFLFAFLLPVLAANSIGGANFAERYLYLPSIGLAWLAGLAWSRIAGSHRAVTAAALAGLIVLGIAAWARSTIYGSDLTLFSEVVRVNPRNEIARNNLGMALYHEGRLDEAEREYRLALRLKPRNVAPLSNLAVLRERQGRSAEAEKLFEDVLRISPVHAVAAVHLARAQIARGDQTGAARRLDALFAAGGESYDALVERADLWLEEGRPEKAVPLLERAVEMFPGRVKGREMLGRARKVSPPNVETPCRRLRGGRTV
ncbi:MAG TPA: tetratricopeptide repeat protein [Thermoanaerobaculia bacterium]|nr:tetratricopeptide repeat protein [Thermoanaerobaculia bacterium]